ncbi:MAG TPA: NADH-quinone oxidoreductase subunit C, partial [Phototrophicaceae bacterium]|nr:NADH-quinone oxidoreductase subunit C [Phototrophicaceae bacterium]
MLPDAQTVTAPVNALGIDEAIAALKAKYPGVVTDDTRQGYYGVIVDKNKLIDVATTLRDELGFNYLSSATAVDYEGLEGSTNHLEMVYHAYQITGGKALVFKAQTDRENAEIPSLIDVYPGADFQEREAYDLFGIRFPGHPNLKRILMWDGFEGHPMRKDWKEAYYEQEHKPYDSRWPGGYVRRSEEANAFGHNVKYPADFDLSRLKDVSEETIYNSMGLGVDVQSVSGDSLRTDRLVVNMGPHHP